MYQAGVGKAKITGLKKGVGMMGYGMAFNYVKRKETDLFARAFVIKDTAGKKIVFVNAEIAFITISIKRGVINCLQKDYPEYGHTLENVLLSAQHTHSGPGGYSHYGFYNFSIPGFVPEVYQEIVEGIVDAIVQAENSLTPARININKGSFAPEIEVAFNRSMSSYNRNPDVIKYHENESHLAINREMTLVRIDTEQGDPLGMINWFGVHCTSVHNDNNSICFDNKGYASQFFEEDLAKDNPDFIAAFAQNPAGDITPNYIWDKKKKWTRGKFENDFESAAHNGRLQYQKAKEIYQNTENQQIVSGPIDYGLMYANFANVLADPEFTNSHSDAKTAPACHGVAFLKGTVEGPGMGSVEAVFATFLSKVVKTAELIKSKFQARHERQRILDKYKAQGRKHIIIETGERRMLGTGRLDRILIPSWADPTIRTLKLHYKNGALGHKPWTPQTLPLHMVIIGHLALVGIPGEITVVAGKRLKDTILDILKQRGVTEVIITSYCNAYSGYITTYEEYQEQRYEGGHTVFGEWTLAAFQTKFKQLALEMLKKPEDRSIETTEPVLFSEEELGKRSFVES